MSRIVNGTTVATVSETAPLARRRQPGRLTILKQGDGSNEVVSADDPRVKDAPTASLEDIPRYVRGGCYA